MLDLRLGAESVFAREPTPANPFSFSIDSHTLFCALDSELARWKETIGNAIDEEIDLFDEADDDGGAALAALPPAPPATATRRYSRALSLRMDGSVGPFTRDQFLSTYGGTDEWDDAAELRVDSDGGIFSMQEFVTHYGGTDEWDAAEPVNWLASHRI